MDALRPDWLFPRRPVRSKPLSILGGKQMVKSRSWMRSVLFALPLLISMCCFHAGPAVAGVLGLLVPAYFYPGTGGPGGVGDGWSSLSSASASVPLIAIFNPNSGPAPGPPDPNYVQAMTQVEKAGGQIVAYAYTGGGTVTIERSGAGTINVRGAVWIPHSRVLLRCDHSQHGHSRVLRPTGNLCSRLVSLLSCYGQSWPALVR